MVLNSWPPLFCLHTAPPAFGPQMAPSPQLLGSLWPVALVCPGPPSCPRPLCALGPHCHPPCHSWAAGSQPLVPTLPWPRLSWRVWTGTAPPMRGLTGAPRLSPLVLDRHQGLTRMPHSWVGDRNPSRKMRPATQKILGAPPIPPPLPHPARNWVARQKVLSLGQNEVALSTGVVRLQGRGGWGREEGHWGGAD